MRNGRRLVGDFVLTETHLRRANPEPVDDSVGLIWWPPDFHSARCLVKEGRVWNEGAVFNVSEEPDWQPCGIPYRSLVPKAAECTNLLSPTCPSSSYVAYGAYRIRTGAGGAGGLISVRLPRKWLRLSPNASTKAHAAEAAATFQKPLSHSAQSLSWRPGG